ncbi:hypothetical protein ABPG72_019626 [Tetrahymena utriculariae]
MGLSDLYQTVTDKIDKFEEYQKSPSVYALVGCFFYVMVGFCVKTLNGISATQILYFRCIISMVLNTFIIKIGKHDIYPQNKEIFKLLMMRCIFGGIAHVCYYQGIKLLNLGDAQAIFLTSPIWTSILASIWLKEKLQPSVISSIIISFIGIVLIVKPPFLLSFLGLQANSSSFNDPYAILGLAASIVFSFLESLSALLIRSLSNSVKVTAVIQYVYISGFALNGSFMIMSGSFNAEVYSSSVFPIICSVALLNFLAQLFYSRGLQIGKSQDVVPFQYSQLVMSFIVDIVIFNKELNYLSLIGSGLILLGNYKILFRQ